MKAKLVRFLETDIRSLEFEFFRNYTLSTSTLQYLS
jgi:hypothetical protein